MPFDQNFRRLFGFFAGIAGLCGVALAAAANHLDDPRLFGSAALICLVHAPALLALSLGGGYLRTAKPAGLLILVGTLLFAGDLFKRHFTGSGFFPMSAPTGGIAMMLGWIVAGLGALLPLRES